MADMSKVPPSIRAVAEREAALKALPSIITRLEAIEEWATQNGWDVATGFIKSDLSEGKERKTAKAGKGGDNAATSSTD